MTTPKLEEIQQVTQIFKMLSDPTRLKILLSPIPNNPMFNCLPIMPPN